MPGRGPQTFKKRQKEQQRKEKQQEKFERRLARKRETGTAGPASHDAPEAITAEDGENETPKTDVNAAV